MSPPRESERQKNKTILQLLKTICGEYVQRRNQMFSFPDHMSFAEPPGLPPTTKVPPKFETVPPEWSIPILQTRILYPITGTSKQQNLPKSRDLQISPENFMFSKNPLFHVSFRTTASLGQNNLGTKRSVGYPPLFLNLPYTSPAEAASTSR